MPEKRSRGRVQIATTGPDDSRQAGLAPRIRCAAPGNQVSARFDNDCARYAATTDTIALSPSSCRICALTTAGTSDFPELRITTTMTSVPLAVTPPRYTLTGAAVTADTMAMTTDASR